MSDLVKNFFLLSGFGFVSMLACVGFREVRVRGQKMTQRWKVAKFVLALLVLTMGAVFWTTEKRLVQRWQRNRHCRTGCWECYPEILGSCDEHPMTDVTLQPEGPGWATYAERSLPHNLEIRESNIPAAGRRVFAKTAITNNTTSGPYGGEKRDADRDAGTPVTPGPYINTASSEAKQNLAAFQYCGQIFYKACRPIESGEELLTYYGDEYAIELGLLKSPERFPAPSLLSLNLLPWSAKKT